MPKIVVKFNQGGITMSSELRERFIAHMNLHGFSPHPQSGYAKVSGWDGSPQQTGVIRHTPIGILAY